MCVYILFTSFIFKIMFLMFFSKISIIKYKLINIFIDQNETFYIQMTCHKIKTSSLSYALLRVEPTSLNLKRNIKSVRNSLKISLNPCKRVNIKTSQLGSIGSKFPIKLHQNYLI